VYDLETYKRRDLGHRWAVASQRKIPGLKQSFVT
jgi:hypothetical protein